MASLMRWGTKREMGIYARRYKFLIVPSILVALMAGLGGCGGGTTVEVAPPPDPGVNLIAYVDLQGQVNTITPDGSSIVKISPEDGFYTWPLWSPDASHIAFSGTSFGTGGTRPLGLYVYRLEDGQRNQIYTNEPGMGPILSGMPHYPFWAPDGSLLAFMASDPRGLTLFLTDPLDNIPAEVVLHNAPLYASWSGSSSHILVHGGFDHFLVDVLGGGEVHDLGIQGGGYRVPAWSPSADRIAFVSEERSDTSELYITDIAFEDRILLEEIRHTVAFLWSPNGQSLAVAQSEFTAGLIYQGVSIFSLDGTRQHPEVQEEESVIAFYWSPDSTRLAYVTLADRLGILRWMVLNVADGSRWPLIEFRPSRGQVTLLTFFDQFALTHGPWAPDSGSLVFSGTLAGGASSASSNLQGVPQIIVTGAGPVPYSEAIADGLLGFWSPR